MKLKSFASVAASGLLFVALTPALSFAETGVNSGNVKFEGLISSVSCKVQVDANESGVNTGTVKFGNILPSVFNGVGTASEFKEFNINLSGGGCTDGSKAAVSFHKDGFIDNATGNLRLIDGGAGSASGVQIQIHNNGAAPGKIDLSENNNQQVADVVGNKAVLKFKASYVAVSDTIVEGRADSNINFDVTYN
ncbi:fimbrial protein [Pseudomonas sp. Au-Pse12]|uniref:fimbrial protein n=1 Tax=Pseudomonas sp. Au-Pse12 TaxID=2906459 RepID=UPI001E4992B6|nr:fimbrial protein [Pseudomonas sp. Au-Pse12]MCE4053214.1 type 1 fimbrial protein [Pseudomonas sp. Au-Pse12]